MRRGHAREPAVERAGRRAPVPDRMRVDHRLHQPVEPVAGQARDRDHRHALELRQPVVGLLAQLLHRAGLALDQVPLVHADDDRAAFALDQIGDAQVLLLERRLRIHQQDHHLGEAHRIERVGDRELLELLLDARAPPQPGGVVDAEVRPRQSTSTAIASRVMPASGPGEQPLLAEQAVDQRRLAGVRPADDARRGSARRRRSVASGSARRRSSCGRCARRARGLLRQRRAQRIVEIGQAPRRARPRSRPARRARAHRPRATPACAARPSLLLATRIAGLPERRTRSAKARSTGVGPVRASIRNSTASAAAIAASVCACMRPVRRRRRGLLEAGGVDRGEGEIAEPRARPRGGRG